MRKTIDLEDREIAREMMGVGDSHLRRVKEALGVTVISRNEKLQLEGSDDAVERAARAFLAMQRIVRKTQKLQLADVDRILDAVEEDHSDNQVDDAGLVGHPGHPRKSKEAGERPLAGRVHPMTTGQERYIAAMKKHDIVFAVGPAGCGKTYLAVAAAIEALSKNQVNRIVLVRPAVEAGEHLGFLPGDLQEKVNPYLRPLYDALHDMLNPHQVARFSEKGVIEIAPLAFMRGRTLNSAFVILDEAQNTTPKQMKMFLTRLGRDAKTVITGDITQVDLPDGDLSGLTQAMKILKDVEGVSFVSLEKQDIVRHPLVQRIVQAYDKYEA